MIVVLALDNQLLLLLLFSRQFCRPTLTRTDFKTPKLPCDFITVAIPRNRDAARLRRDDFYCFFHVYVWWCCPGLTLKQLSAAG